MKVAWNEKSLLHKIVTVISILSGLSVIVLSLLQMSDIWDQAINVCVPLMGVTMLCQAYLQWKTSKAVAYVSLGTAVFVFLCAAAVFFLK